MKICPHFTALGLRHLAFAIRNDLSFSKFQINLLLALVLSQLIVFEQDGTFTVKFLKLDYPFIIKSFPSLEVQKRYGSFPNKYLNREQFHIHQAQLKDADILTEFQL